MSTVALVPAFRRADRVGATVRGLLTLVERVVVIDDGSDDRGATAAAAREAGATVVVLPANRGKGGALAAGIAATPEAATYLLIDADTASTAAATGPLLAALDQGADLAIGVLPSAAGRGGFGTVRSLAAWGIRRACGFEAAAPLSGQRAVRGSLLRSLEAADRFGVEVGMTIDAVRAGAHVVEVPVEVEHAHTGRSVAGFSHRAGQGFDLLRALWPRLLAEPARRLLLVAAAVAAVAMLAGSATVSAPNGAALGPVDSVVLVAAPPTLRLDDLDAPSRPELTALAGRRGAAAAANVDVPGHSAWSTWATVGAGATLRAEAPTREPDPDRPFRVLDVEKGQGRLGDALHRAGRTTSFVGTGPTSPVRLAVADRAGETDRAATAASLGAAGLANRTRFDLAAGTAVTAVDATGLDPGGLEDLLAGLRPQGDERRLLILVTPADPGGTFGLRPLVASGPGAPAGRLASRSTRRDGLVLLSDVAPTVLAALGLPVPDDMDGRPLRRISGSPDLAGLVEADRLARQRTSLWDPALLALVPLHLATYAWAWRRRHRQGVRRQEARMLHQLGLGLVGWPLATWLTRAVPGSGGLGRGAGLLALALDALVVALAWRLGRRRGLAPLALVLGATIALITVDLGFGSGLQLSSAIGNAAHTAGRFTGLGNAAFAVYAACALLAVHCGRRPAPWMAALLVLVALADALPPLGDDVGGALTLAPIFTLAVVALWGRLSLRALVLAAAATVAVLALALAVDLARPPEERTHLARFVTGDGGASVGGKLTQNLGTYLAIPPLVLVVAITLAAAVLVWRGRFAGALPPGSPARIGVAATLAVALAGNLLNDSGPIVTLLAVSILAPALVVRAAAAAEPPPQLLPPAASTLT